MAPAARSVFKQLAPDFALDNFNTMQESFAKSDFNDRVGLYLIGAFGGMAVLMVIAGLYGVLAQIVGYRRREIGIRLALGATPRGILSMVLRQASRLVVAGIAAGIALAAAAGKLEAGFLYGVKRHMDVRRRDRPAASRWGDGGASPRPARRRDQAYRHIAGRVGQHC